jgi:hypothetical protein
MSCTRPDEKTAQFSLRAPEFLSYSEFSTNKEYVF